MPAVGFFDLQAQRYVLVWGTELEPLAPGAARFQRLIFLAISERNDPYRWVIKAINADPPASTVIACSNPEDPKHTVAQVCVCSAMQT